MKFDSTILIITSGLVLASCGDDADRPSDVPADAPDDAPPDTGTPDLPAPAVDTVEMSLNGVRVTLGVKEFCRNGAAGIGFAKSDTPGDTTPTLFLHNVDLTDSGEIVIKTGGAWHLDIDDQVAGAVWGTTDQGCAATIIESSETAVEIKARDCAIRAQFGTPQTGVTSFHFRCARDD